MINKNHLKYKRGIARTLSGFIILFSLISCKTSNDKTLATCPAVGSIKQIGDDSVIICDQKLLKDTIRIPLSLLVDDFEIIRLDNKNEALVGDQQTVISENYILVWNKQQNPFKLFDRKGNFITMIGSIGQGPGEYQTIYDAQIDEKNDRIYLLPWTSSQLLVYDLKGNSLPPIPLCLRVPKGKIHVQDSNLIAAVLLPFPGLPAIAWTQDFLGERKAFIAPGDRSVYDYNSEIISGGNTSAFDVMIRYVMPARTDTFYHYDFQNNRLRPKFVTEFSEDPVPEHGFQELSNHFLCYTYSTIQVSKYMFDSANPAYYIIDKQTLKGAYMHLINDFLGNTELPLRSFDGHHPPFPNFRNGYFILNMDPGNLQTELQNALKTKDLSPDKEAALKKMLISINENDNNYILLGRLKK